MTQYIYDNTAGVSASDANNQGRLVYERFYDSAGAFTAGTQSSRNVPVHYTYDAMGRMHTVTDDSGTTTNSYDVEGNLTAVNSPEGTITYSYNSLNQRTSTVTSSTSISYGYDNQGRLTSTSVNMLNGSSASGTTYDYYNNVGLKRAEELPNGLTSTYSYDSLNRLTGLQTLDGSGNTVLQDVYTLKPDGSRATLTEVVGNQAEVDTTWTYDALDRLLAETATSGNSALAHTDTYTYDLDGNRLSKTHVTTGTPQTTTYVYNGDNQLIQSVDTASGTTTYTYDANGSQTSTTNGATVTSTVYDIRNKMVSYALNGVTQSTYVYDDAGNRVKETVSGTTSSYLIDTDNPTGYPKPIEARTNGVLTTYIEGDRVLAQANSSSAITYLLVDARGNTRALANASGTITANLNYDAFDVPINFNPATIGTMFQVGDSMYDAASGFNFHAYGRQSNNVIGRFIIQDDQVYVSNANPITDNFYLLDGADPTNRRDFNGHEFVETLSAAVIQLGLRVGDIVARIGPAALSAYGLAIVWSASIVTAIPTALNALTVVGAGVEILDNITASWTTAPAPPRGVNIGRYYEDANPKAINLAGNYEGIDAFDSANGIATSVRTHALGSAENLLSAISRDAQQLNNATKRNLTGIARNGGRVDVSADSVNLKQLIVGVRESDAGIIQDQSFLSSLNQIATRFKTVIRVVPIREWAEELEQEVPH